MKLCLLDANIVIYLHELGLWEAMLQRFEILLARTVCDEAEFWVDAKGDEHPIELKPGTYSEVVATATEVADLKQQFRGLQIDAGELESLAWLLSDRADELCQFCSSDAVVFKVLGAKHEGSRGVSLEELLHAAGNRRTVNYQYTKAFRDRYTAQGLGLFG